AAIAGIAQAIVDRGLHGHARAVEIGIVAFPVLGPFARVVAEIEAFGQQGQGGGVGAGIFGQGDGAGLIGGAAIAGVAQAVFVEQFGGGPGAGKAGVVAFPVIGPGAGVVAKIDVGGGIGIG